MSWTDYDQLPAHVKDVVDRALEFDPRDANNLIKLGEEIEKKCVAFKAELEKLDDLFEKVEKLGETLDLDSSFAEIVEKLEAAAKVDADTTVADLVHELYTARKWLTDLHLEFGEVKAGLAAFSEAETEALKEAINNASLAIRDQLNEVTSSLDTTTYIDAEELVSELAFRGVTLHYENPVAKKTPLKPTVTERLAARAKVAEPKCHAVVRHMVRAGGEKSFHVSSSWEAIDERDLEETVIAKVRAKAEAMGDGVQRRSLLRAAAQRDLKKLLYFHDQTWPDERYDINRLPKRGG